MNKKIYVPQLLKEGRLRRYKMIRLLTNSMYVGQLLEAYQNLLFGLLYQSSIHGPGHIDRVMLFGAIIAQSLGFDKKDTDTLLVSCSYHDVGRINDYVDPDHGKRGAEIISNNAANLFLSGDELAIVLAAVSVHSTSDEKLDDFIDLYSVKDKERAKRIAYALKDADNLDRVRIGDLDASYLRYKESRKMIRLAEAVFQSTILCSFGL